MKQEKRFRYCENCNKAWEIASPPTNNAYESGFIEMSEKAVLLLPKKSRPNHSTCAKWIEGIFCNVICLTECINEVLHRKARR